MEMQQVERNVERKVNRVVKNYQGAQTDVPVVAYTAFIGAYTALSAFLYAVVREKNAEPKLTPSDYPLMIVSTYKLSRIVTMDWVTSPVRAPFTKRGKSLPDGEVQDKSRGSGLQKAMGNLMTCPYCFSVWAGTAIVFGMTVAPRATRLFNLVMAAAAGADGLHATRKVLRERYLED